MKILILAAAMFSVAGCKPSSEVAGGDSTEPVETVHLTAGEFESFIVAPGKLAAVMFHADWCGPCRRQEPVVEEVVAEFGGKVVFGLVNVDKASDLAQRLGVNGIPDLRLYRNGIMVDAMTGVVPIEQVRNHLAIQVDQLGDEPTAAGDGSSLENAIQPMSKTWKPPGIERR